MTLLAAALALDASYKFSPSTKVEYRVKVAYDGFLPLLGGNEGKAVVDLLVKVEGLEPKTWQRAACELTEFGMTFNDAKIPLGIEDAKPFFPRTTVSVDKFGTVQESDAPNLKVPVRLPGLDVQRFPDVTFLPVTLPSGGLVVGRPWTFQKAFSGSPMHYECAVVRLDGQVATISLKVRQNWSGFENEAVEEVGSVAEAVSRTETQTIGSGTVVFDSGRGLVSSLRLVSNSETKVTDIKSGKVTVRKLASEVSSDLVAPVPRTVVAPPRAGLWGVVDRAVKTGRGMWETGSAWVSTARLFLVYGLRTLPGIGGLLPQIPWLGGGR